MTRTRTRTESLLFIANVVALIGIAAFLCARLIVPYAAEYAWGDDYKELVFKCDNVMRDHFIAKSKVLAKPSDESIRDLKAAEVGLFTCHDYDRLRKRLMRFGVGEARLSEMGLEAIEERAQDVREFVRTHEIRY